MKIKYRDILIGWVREFKPSANSINALLSIFKNFPTDYRSLLKTLRITKIFYIQ